MFARDALERCYNVENIKQYRLLVGDASVRGKTKVKIVRDCHSKAP